MCGIVGVICKNATEKVLEILKRIEYRGYDSCGVAALIDGKLRVTKTLGSVFNLKLDNRFDRAKIAIGHTRWATHGVVSIENAQPVVFKNFATVHNGMIPNYYEYLDSDIDSFVIPYLFCKGYTPDYIIRELKGAITSITLSEDSKLIAIKRGSPLIIGRSKNIYVLSSDYQSISDLVDEFVILPDNSYLILSEKGVEKSSIELKWEKSKRSSTVYYEPKEVPAGYYTFREIQEQTFCLTNCLENKTKIQEFASNLSTYHRILFVGAGSSFHSALYGKYLLLGKRCCIQAIPASEFYTDSDKLIGGAIVALSQSGETADVLHVINRVSKNHDIYAITNNPHSTLARIAKVCLFQNVGAEYSVIATKTYTSQLILLYLINKVWENKLSSGIKEVISLQEQIMPLITRITPTIKKLAKILCKVHNIYVLGRKLNYVTALETALKLKEACYIHAEAIPAGELKHGALALIEEGSYVIAFVDSSDERTLLNLSQVRARGGKIITVSPIDCQYFDYWIKVPEFGELNPVVQIIVSQLLAYYTALEKNINPDRPRNLAKTVTVL